MSEEYFSTCIECTNLVYKGTAHFCINYNNYLVKNPETTRCNSFEEVDKDE